jgi:hypothetical protein
MHLFSSFTQLVKRIITKTADDVRAFIEKYGLVDKLELSAEAGLHP